MDSSAEAERLSDPRASQSRDSLSADSPMAVASQFGSSTKDSRSLDYTASSITDYSISSSRDDVSRALSRSSFHNEPDNLKAVRVIDDLGLGSLVPIEISDRPPDQSALPEGDRLFFRRRDLRITSVRDFSREIRSAMVGTDDRETPSRKFLPLDELYSLVSEANVRRVLQLANPSADAAGVTELARQISGPGLRPTGRRKLFAILVLLEQVQLIGAVIKAGVEDRHLPLNIDWPSRATCYIVSCPWDDTLENPLPCFSDLGDVLLTSFDSLQRHMLTPRLQLGADKPSFFKLPPGAVLPLLKTESIKDGGYGSVSRIKIHPAHYTCLQPTHTRTNYNLDFAIKKLLASDSEQFRQEVEVLARFSTDGKTHQHLIRLLAAFQYEGHGHLIFPLAQGNLKDFWLKYPQWTKACEGARWFMEQCCGIVDALSRIHGFANRLPSGGRSKTAPTADEKQYGRHSDIKPDNILWFEDGQRQSHQLVITDFGLTRFHSKASRSLDADPGGYSHTYRAPELDLKKMRITQRYDVWSLGCVFLELVVWFTYGHGATFAFSTARATDDGIEAAFSSDDFFIINHSLSRAQVKTSVTEWIDKIRREPESGQFVVDFLGLIQREMLVCDPSTRSDCDRIRDRLAEIRRRCDLDDEYCTKKEPVLKRQESSASSKRGRSPSPGSASSPTKRARN